MVAMPLRDPERGDVQVDRRGFLGLMTHALLWLFGVTGVGGLVRFLSYDPDPTPTGRYTLERPSAYTVGASIYFSEERIVLFRDHQGFYARSLICPHLGCMVEKSEWGYQCPCHGSRFGKLGDLMNGPASKSLNSVWLGLDEEGRLVVDVSSEVAWEWRLTI